MVMCSVSFTAWKKVKKKGAKGMISGVRQGCGATHACLHCMCKALNLIFFVKENKNKTKLPVLITTLLAPKVKQLGIH